MNTCDSDLCRQPAGVLDDTFVNNLLNVLLIAANALKVWREHCCNPLMLSLLLNMLREGRPRDRIHVVLHGKAAIWCPKMNSGNSRIVDNIRHKTSLFGSLIT